MSGRNRGNKSIVSSLTWLKTDGDIIQRMKRLIITLMLMTFFLAACAGSPPESGEIAPQEELAAAEVQETKTTLPRPTDEPAVTASPETEANTPEPAAETSATQAAEQAISVEPPTLTPLPAPTEEPVPLVISGQTDDGVFFLGDPNAPLTIIDYSDFL